VLLLGVLISSVVFPAALRVGGMFLCFFHRFYRMCVRFFCVCVLDFPGEVEGSVSTVSVY
jgi:hypothetical protein